MVTHPAAGKLQYCGRVDDMFVSFMVGFRAHAVLDSVGDVCCKTAPWCISGGQVSMQGPP